MAVAPKPRALDWFALAAGALHPIKLQVLEHLAENGNVATSPNDFAQAFGLPLGRVSYHVRQLVDPEVFDPPLLVLERVEPRRGALQHFYVASDDALLSPRQAAYRALQRSASKITGEPELSPDSLARSFHELYERLAPKHGYETRKESAVPWADVPDQNKKLMRAVAGELLRGVAGA